MSQVSVNVVAPLGYTGPTLAGNNNYVQIVDASGDPVFKLSGNNNTAIGKDSLNSSTTGAGNTAIGDQTLTEITTQIDNVAVGYKSLKLSQGGGSTAVGSRALEAVVTGSQNDAFGSYSLLLLTSGSLNTAIGSGAGSNLPSGTRNTFVGFGAGSSFNGPSEGNIVVGNSMGYAYTGNSGNDNTFIGKDAGHGITSGNDNVIIGKATISYPGPKTGNNNILIGTNAEKASLSASNSITLGNSSNNILRCAVTSITSLSDERDKKEIEELPVGLEFVKGLKPVKFVWDERSEEGRHNIKDFGFIAQDLKASQEEVEMAETLKLVYEENPEKLEASYGKLIPILVKAIQELSEEVKQLKNK
jgi:hypothetical protein